MNISKEIQELQLNYEKVNNNDFFELFYLLRKLRSIVDFQKSSNYDDQFQHIYHATSIYVSPKETNESQIEQRCKSLRRDLDFLVNNLNADIGKDR